MKFHFNKFERVAGIFVVVAFLGFVLSLISVAVKQGWFDKKIYYSTVFENAEGVHPGTLVQLAGLKCGSVEEVDLTAENKIYVRFYVLAKFADKVRGDSISGLIRPFIIGERVLDISPGSLATDKLQEGMQMPSLESTDLMTMISGRKLGSSLATMTEMLGNLRQLAEAFLDKDRAKSFVTMFDEIQPLIKNLNSMSLEVMKLSKQATHDDNLGVVLGQLAVTTKQINAMIPGLEGRAPELAKDMGNLISNLAQLTEEFKVVIPALTTVAPELPRVSKRAVEALDEAVVLMKAMEKSFLVRSNVREVRDEEEAKRRPASGDSK